MGQLTAFTPDRLTAHERFRRVTQALSRQDTETALQLQAATPQLAWVGPDMAFTERLRVAGEMTRTFAADLSVAVTKLTMLTAFEQTLRDFDAVLQNEMAFAWKLGWEAAGGSPDAHLTPHQEKLTQLQAACQIPPTFPASIADVRTICASLWEAWQDFTRAAWRLKPEQPIRAWGPANAEELLATVHANTSAPDPAQVALYRQPYDLTWDQTLAAIAARMGGN
jgi:hypothetical protein